MQTTTVPTAPTHEESELRDALTRADGSPQAAADLLGVSRMTVWRRMKKYGIELTRVIADPAEPAA